MLCSVLVTSCFLVFFALFSVLCSLALSLSLPLWRPFLSHITLSAILYHIALESSIPQYCTTSFLSSSFFFLFSFGLQDARTPPGRRIVLTQPQLIEIKSGRDVIESTPFRFLGVYDTRESATKKVHGREALKEMTTKG